jgi:hypothetical protein
MHPGIHYEIAQARVADLHHQAQRDALALAAGRARRARRDRSRCAVPARPARAARRMLAFLLPRSA